MHHSPIDENHALALHVAVLLSSRCGMCAHSDFAYVNACEAYNLEVLLGDGGDGSRCRLV